MKGLSNTIIWLMSLLFSAVSVSAQEAAETARVVVSGVVTDASTGRPVPQATIAVAGTHVSVVSNDDGFFTLKAAAMPHGIVVSCVGYQSQAVRGQNLFPKGKGGDNGRALAIALKPTAISLSEIVVWTEDPRELVRIAMSKIPQNYSREPELFRGFYRETAMKRQHYIYVAEGVVDMYKTAYDHNNYRDRVAIRKGRRLLSSKQGDTLTVKVMGGPVQPIQLDIVKNHDFLLNAQELNNYNFEMLPSTTIADRLQYVVAISPRWPVEWPLYNGRLYIDRETLAFTRAELSLDVSDREKATRYMLIRKPAGVRFRPRELSTLIDYRYDQGVTRISYIRNTFRFNCDWKRRLFATSFTACCEMVVTDHEPAKGRAPISGRDSFDSRDAFYDKVDFFLDPLFWEDYNIIEPSVSLDEAIDKLLKKRIKR